MNSTANDSKLLPNVKFCENDIDSAIAVFQHYLSNRKDKRHASVNSKVKKLFNIASRVLNPEDKKTRVQKRKYESELKHKKDKEKLKNTILSKRFLERSGVNNPDFDPESVYKMIYTDIDTLPESKEKLYYQDKCYVCQNKYQELHQFYSRLCPPCAEFNWNKRQNRVDMKGKTCIVTGGRIKVGFCIALKLLRMGATVIVTTRFPNDAALRYSKEADFQSFSGRLYIYGLDFRDLLSVSEFSLEIKSKFKALHVLINNAAQTVRKPPQFYQHLIGNEFKSLPTETRKVISVFSSDTSRKFVETTIGSKEQPLTKFNLNLSTHMSQIPLLPTDSAINNNLFPPSKLDGDLQQIDLRQTNSWVSKLGTISTIEMVECHLINAFAPWSLITELLPLLQDTLADKYIVNVSAKEGQFYRNKTYDHPHTNMAKASLNMLTRTSAGDLKTKGIYMAAVDTGWITDENPQSLKNSQWIQPIDEWDAAMRVLDPILSGFQGGEKYYGVFLKDYKPSTCSPPLFEFESMNCMKLKGIRQCANACVALKKLGDDSLLLTSQKSLYNSDKPPNLPQNNFKMYSRPMAKAIKMLKRKCNKLSLFRKKITDDDVETLSKLIKDGNLTKIDLSDNNITELGTGYLMQALLPVQPVANSFESEKIPVSTLEILDLSQNLLGHRGTELVSDLIRKGKLVSVNLGYNNIRSRGAISIANSLTWNPAVEVLNLENNSICTYGAKALAKSLMGNKKLQSLNLEANVFGDVGTRLFSEALLENKTLSELNLRSALITDLGAGYIANMLKHNTTLLKLDLAGNEISDAGGNLILRALEKNQTVMFLSLKDCAVSKHTQELIKKLLERNKKKLEHSKELMNIARKLAMLNLPNEILCMVLEQYSHMWTVQEQFRMHIYILAAAVYAAGLEGLTNAQVRQLHFQNAMKNNKLSKVVSKAHTTAQFNQLRDHFNPSDTTTWGQSYFVNDDYYQSGGPIFLEIGGEAPIDTSYLPIQLETNLAQRYNGKHIILEHRYYGSSSPVNNAGFNLANYQWLSSQQAIEDIANFIRSYNAPAGTKWIAIGGSYAGALAAWARMIHPDLIYAAHSSSGPVLALADFWQYGHGVDEGIAKSGGSDACAAGWRRAVALSDAASMAPGQDIRDARDKAFYSTILSFSVQYKKNINPFTYNGQTTTLLDAVCGGRLFPTFTNPQASDADALADYNKLAAAMLTQAPPAGGVLSAQAGTAWKYQLCTEFGFFQTGEQQTSFSSYYTVARRAQECQGTFGPSTPAANPDATNSKYKGLDIVNQATKILFVQGAVDPWRYLGVTGVPNSNNVFISIPNGHHCSDLKLPDSSTPSDVAAAHSSILAVWDKWIGPPANPTSTGSNGPIGAKGNTASAPNVSSSSGGVAPAGNSTTSSGNSTTTTSGGNSTSSGQTGTSGGLSYPPTNSPGSSALSATASAFVSLLVVLLL
ncbi:hypothetical protein HDV06_005219 [Boothiomyces sp. JEL0866]|nr:hypothetical protein HDV06_005219 [Boothiomyces sp. JEL0866]